jgi:hypothetical protein
MRGCKLPRTTAVCKLNPTAAAYFFAARKKDTANGGTGFAMYN